MERSEIERLYERIVAQTEYPGGVCPTERNLVRLITQTLSTVERKRMEDHLS